MADMAYIAKQRGDGVMTSLGMDIFHLDEETSMTQLLQTLKQKNYAIVFVSEAVYEENIKVINAYNQDFSLTVLVLANQMHHKNLGQKRLRGLIEDAVGVKVE